MIIYKMKDRIECSNYRGISRVAHAGKILLQIIARHLSEYCERLGILPEEQSDLRPNRSTIDMMFVIRGLYELGGNKQIIPLYVYFIDLAEACDPVKRSLLWTALARFGVSQNIISVIRQFHDGMRACLVLRVVRCGTSSSSTVRSRASPVQRLLRGDINVAYTRFKANKDIMDDLVHLRKTKGVGVRGEATAGESALAMQIWGMLYAEGVVAVSQSPAQPRKTMGVSVVVCVAFGVTVSEVKTEIICLKGMPGSIAKFNV